MEYVENAVAKFSLVIPDQLWKPSTRHLVVRMEFRHSKEMAGIKQAQIWG